MKVLVVTHKPTFPAIDGGTVATRCIINGLLEEGVETGIVSIETAKHPAGDPEFSQAPLFYEKCFVDTNVNAMDAFINLFSQKSYNIERFRSKPFAELIGSKLKSQDFDFVILESLYTAPYINIVRENSNAKIILRSHNVEHEIWQRLSENESNILKQKYYIFLAKRLKKYELKVLQDLDGLVAISQRDLNFFSTFNLGCPSIAITLGVDVDLYEVEKKESEDSVGFLGSLDWLPNIDGVHWLVDKVWPIVNKELPHLKLFIAGRNAMDNFRDNAALNLHILAEVVNARDFIARQSVLVVPLFSGSGVRVKVIETMALGKRIVSTSVGAEGLDLSDKKELLIADTAEGFAKGIISLIKDPKLGNALSLNAKACVIERFNQTSLAKDLISFLNTIR